MLSSFLLTLSVVTLTQLAAKAHESSIHIDKFRPTFDNEYVCTSKSYANDTFYITEYFPSDQYEAAHHIILYGCSEPGVANADVWYCGEMNSDNKDKSGLPQGPICKGDEGIIFVEAMQAGSYALPPDVSFEIGKGTRFPYLVIQIHYKSVAIFEENKQLTDSSGIDFKYQTEPTMFTAGVILLGSDGEIRPNRKTALGEEHLDIICTPDKLPRYQNIVPFSFRVHAHYHGVLVSGFRVRNLPFNYRHRGQSEWTLIGVQNPQEEQTFYPVGDMVIRPGDTLTARCVYSNPTDSVIKIGPTADDEMCNFYIMYYTEDEEEGISHYPDYPGEESSEECFSSGQYTWWDNQAVLGNVPQWVDELSLGFA